MNQRLSRSLFFLTLGTLGALCSLTLAKTSTASDFFSPRTAGLGGAGHAGPLLSDAIYLNPSYSSFLKTYSFAAHYLTFSGSDQIGPSGEVIPHFGRNYSISIQDGSSPLFQAGAAYTVREDGRFVHLGVSKTVVDRLGFGIGGKVFMPGDPNFPTVFDTTFSTTFLAYGWLQAALIVDNMVQTNQAKNAGLYREVILGTKTNLEGIVLVYLDPHWVPDLPSGQAWGYEAGLEFAFFNDIFFRLGAFSNAQIPFQNARGRGLSIGVGWVAPRISFDYGFVRVLEFVNGVPPENAHSFGATIYF